jgi:hypothetical protein
LSTLVLPLLASAAQGDHEKAPTLGSVTRVQADRSGVSELVLHEQAVVDTTKPGSVTIKGAGRLVGMWLQQQDGPGLLVGYRLPAFAGGKQVTFGSAADCNAPSDDGLSLVPSCGSGPTVLPPGRYTLTVLADGAPLTVTVRAKGVLSRGGAGASGAPRWPACRRRCPCGRTPVRRSPSATRPIWAR